MTRYSISEETLEWAKQHLRDEIQDILDDPEIWSPDHLQEDVEDIRRIAIDLNEDFDKIAQEVGTPEEIKRLKELLHE
jgi:hypothetical protein